MSYQGVAWARDQKAESPTTKLVLLIIADAVGVKTDRAVISIGEIMRRAELSRRSVVDHLARLESLALINRAARRDARGHRTVDEILICRSSAQGAGDALRDDAAKVQEMHSGTPPPRCISRIPKVQEMHTQGAGDAPLYKDRGLLEVYKRSESKRSKPDTTIPDGFPDAEAIETAQAYLASKGVNLSASVEADKFRAHAIANGRKLKDWRAGFRQWCAGAVGYAPSSARIPASIPLARAEPSTDKTWRANLRGFKVNGYWNSTDWGPRPDREGCRVPTAVLAEMGFVPGQGLPA